MTTQQSTLTAAAIAHEINKAGDKYYGEKAKGWDKGDLRRIYFGRDFVTIECDGEVHCRKAGKARAQTIGESAVEYTEQAIERLLTR